MLSFDYSIVIVYIWISSWCVEPPPTAIDKHVRLILVTNPLDLLLSVVKHLHSIATRIPPIQSSTNVYSYDISSYIPGNLETAIEYSP